MDSARLGEGFLLWGNGCVDWFGYFHLSQNRVDIDLGKDIESEQFMFFLYKL